MEDVLVAAINQSRRVGHGGQHCGWYFREQYHCYISDCT